MSGIHEQSDLVIPSCEAPLQQHMCVCVPSVCKSVTVYAISVACTKVLICAKKSTEENVYKCMFHNITFILRNF